MLKICAKFLTSVRIQLYKLLKNNDIPNRRLGKKYIIPKFGVIEYLKGVQL